MQLKVHGIYFYYMKIALILGHYLLKDIVCLKRNIKKQ